MKFFCCDVRRLEVLKLSGSANAIEYLEVRDHLEPDLTLRQRTLLVRLLHPAPGLTPDNVLIDGGQRIPSVDVEWIATGNALPSGADPAIVDGYDDLTSLLVIRTTTAGDFSRYTLHLRLNSGSSEPPAGFDVKLSAIEFSFKVECPTDYDCAAVTTCPPQRPELPDIDYLAKDYTGFRRLMLDRLNLKVPDWRERSAADLGIALVELLAYAADNLSYRQDAIANEAYLGTARKRVSVRRHARLVDYALHDGCNARAWVHIEVAADHTLAKGATLLTRTGSLPTTLTPNSKELRDALAAGAIVFETAHDIDLYTDLNTLLLYTWGDSGCCLPRGATQATLRGAHPDLKVNDVLIFQEIVSPTTFQPEDADRAKRWAVRLTEVTASVDPSGRLFDEPPVDAPLAITEIKWDANDALPFPLCVSVKERPGLEISVAFGNVVLADHGQTVPAEPLGSVPEPHLFYASTSGSACTCDHPDAVPIPVRFRPALASAPLTQGYDLASELAIAATAAAGWRSASTLIARDPHEAMPQIELSGQLGTALSHWTPRRDLLSSSSAATDFVVETENDGTALLRFGDDDQGQRPDAGTAFTATYRVGNGVAGNVGADAIAHIVSTASGVFDALTNSLPASGGIDPEPLDAVRRDAPQAFRTQERAVTANDYAAAAQRRADVQQAAATFRWTGSWHTVFVTADRVGGSAVDLRFKTQLRNYLERFRMAGYDLDVDAPHFVALDIELHICVLPEYFRSAVASALRSVLSNKVLSDGRLGIFHPDNFTFGQPVYLSPIIAAAQSVEGVASVSAVKFNRMGTNNKVALQQGIIPIGRLEIAQLENDPNFRERGRLVMTLGDGK